MSDRTYGVSKCTLETIECKGKPREVDMAAHIRELQAENTKLKQEVNFWSGAYKGLEITSEEEITKLKAERREFGLRVAEAVQGGVKDSARSEYNRYACCVEVVFGSVDLTAIVEQELNK